MVLTPEQRGPDQPVAVSVAQFWPLTQPARDRNSSPLIQLSQPQLYRQLLQVSKMLFASEVPLIAFV
jgi:hypothetical protein